MTTYYRSAIALADAISSGETSAVESLALCIQRVEQFDGVLNAVCNRVDERAKQRAQTLDQATARGERLGPLHGVPMTVKEGYDLVGTPTTWGRPDHADNFPALDSDGVQRLERAGAVVFGKTNVPTDLRDWQSVNPIYGRTVNPWDTSRTPGGSSGGSAVALAVGYTFLEAGSDIGGSLRNPAHFCGVCAHKPTYGIVPTLGHTLGDELVASDISVCGPMARGVDDLSLGLDIMMGVVGPQATAWDFELPTSRHQRLADFRIAVVPDSLVCVVQEEIKQALGVIADQCEAGGANVDRKAGLPVDDWLSHRIYVQLLRAVMAPSLDDEQFETEQASANSFGPVEMSYPAQVSRALTQTYRDWHRATEERARLQRAWASYFETHDALLIPAAPTTAWPHDQAERIDRVIQVDDETIGYYDQLFWAGLTGVVYLPSTVIPMGLDRRGLPMGVQIVAPYLEDRTALALARYIEEMSGGFVAPPGYD